MVYFLFLCLLNWFCTIANLRIICVTEIKNVSILFYSIKTGLAHLTLRFLYIFGCSGPQCGSSAARGSRKSFCASLPLRTVGYSGTRLVPTTYSFLLLLSWLAKIPPKFSTDDFSWAWLAKERKLLYLPSLLRLRPKKSWRTVYWSISLCLLNSPIWKNHLMANAQRSGTFDPDSFQILKFYKSILNILTRPFTMKKLRKFWWKLKKWRTFF